MTAYRLSWAVAGLSYLLVLLGGTVHATGSSLACPDWPLCYGQLFPEMTGGILYEHTHRLLATGVGLLTLALAIVLVRRLEGGQGLAGAAIAGVLVQELLLVVALASNPVSAWPLTAAWLLCLPIGAVILWLFRRQDTLPALGLLAFAAVGAQGMLGGITVVYKLPMLISTTHLALSLLFFGLIVYLAFCLRPHRGGARSLGPRLGVGVATIAVYLQALLGALVRHSGSGLACNVNIFSCNGTWLPTAGPAILHWSHRLLALVVVGVVFWATWPWLRSAPNRPVVRRLALTVQIVVVAQVVLGSLTVFFYISIPWVTTHLGVGSLLLVMLQCLYHALGPLGANGLEPRLAPAGTELAEVTR